MYRRKANVRDDVGPYSDTLGFMAAAKVRTLFLSLAALCLPALANIPRASFVVEKPHLGGSDFALISHQGLAAANVLIAPGIARCLCDGGRRSRSTGKERDAETGLDYFGARYMSAAQGRWTSPDLVNLTSDRLLSPSSTINKYIYGGNNPLRFVDPDGRDITVFYEQGLPTGHIMLAASNQQTGDFAFMSVGPQTHLDSGIPLHPFSGVPGTSAFAMPQTVDDLRTNFAAITIQTTPEVAQQAIDAIRNGAGTGNWALLGNNCTTACAKVLREVGLLGVNEFATPFARPTTLWNTLRLRYQPNLSRWSKYSLSQNSGAMDKIKNGTDYGSPRYGVNTFDWLMLQLKAPLKECVSISDSASGTKSTECK